MSELWSDLIACLKLTTVSETPEVVAFEGVNQRLSYHRLFGGQLLAQFVEAARRMCPDKAVKSIHVQFPREGRDSEPVTYEARRHHEGRSFATIGIVARQSTGTIGTAAVTMHAAEDGPQRQTIADVPTVLGPEHRVEIELLPWDTRTTTDLDSLERHEPELALWMRTPEVDPDLGPAVMAYATDLTLIGTALLPAEGYCQRGNGTTFTSATTSHTMWFHRPLHTDSWLLLRQHSPIVAHGRCFGRGDVLTEDGTLVASYAQEALVRFR
jgi:acyl-CoA thioesterase-2